jgi:PAS domain-containing protein
MLSKNIWIFSEESLRIFGYEPSENVGLVSILEVVHPEDRDAVGKALAQSLEGEREFKDICYLILARSGIGLAPGQPKKFISVS